MWNQYAGSMHGVRICLPIMPFKHYGYGKGEYGASRDTVMHIDMAKCPFPLTLRRYNIPQMPQSIPHRPQLFCPLYACCSQRYADLSDTQTFTRRFSNHLRSELHTCCPEPAFSHSILPDSTYPTVPIVDLHSEFYSSTPRQERNSCTKDDVAQKQIFGSQLQKHVNTDNVEVAILNAFPLFLYEYFK